MFRRTKWKLGVPISRDLAVYVLMLLSGIEFRLKKWIYCRGCNSEKGIFSSQLWT